MKVTVRSFVITVAVLALLSLAVLPVAAQWTSITLGQIAIVWPQSGGLGTSVAQSTAVNISVWPTGAVTCATDPGLALKIGLDNNPTTDVGGTKQLITRTVGSSTFPSIEFNDIPANLLLNPTAKFRFAMYGVVGGGKHSFSGNVWVHASDARTYYPTPVVPVATSLAPAALDTRIQIVWPHDIYGNYQPVEYATRVNVAIEVFEHGTLNAIGPVTGTLPYTVTLMKAVDNGFLAASNTPAPVYVTYTVGSSVYGRWVFNDQVVNPTQKTHFLATTVLSGTIDSQPYASIWTHAADARTYLPYPIVPPSCVAYPGP